MLESNVNDILEHARKVKLRAREMAKTYIKYPNSIIPYAREIWGGITTYLYEKININYDTATRKLLLANIIAERYILKRYRGLYKHMTIAIVGLAGSGKTTYSALSIYGAMKLLGFTNEEIVDTLSSVMLFRSIDYVDLPKQLLEEKKWLPVIVFDDVGSEVNKYWHFMGETFWVYLFSVMDQLKDWVGVLIFTARSFTSIPARFREIVDFVVEAKEVDISGTVLDIFEYYPNVGGNYRKKKNLAYVDVMLPVARMPDEIWHKMMVTRRETGLKRLSVIHSVVERLPEIEEAHAKKLLSKIAKELEKEKEEEASST